MVDSLKGSCLSALACASHGQSTVCKLCCSVPFVKRTDESAAPTGCLRDQELGASDRPGLLLGSAKLCHTP